MCRLDVAPAVAALALAAMIGASGCCHVRAGIVSPEALEEERGAQASRAGAGYVTAASSPFVIVANDAATRDGAVELIAWATARLRADFFEASPGEPITVWVFSDEASYMSGSSAILGTIPPTPYGFYRPCSRSLIVNASYGFGTLVHEIVHAFIHADFPDAPTWLNEGLASLFEGSEERGGHIRGTTNWRLSGLQSAIRRRRTLLFEKLVGGSRGDFDGEEGGLYYAEARYLLYWLQERHELGDFYRAYRASARAKGETRSGLDVLSAITRRDVRALRSEWESFVLGLRYDRRT